MNILLLGATGSVGREVLAQALAAGHRVTALIRNPASLTLSDPSLRIVNGDATDEAVLKTAMHDNQIIISTLGAVSTPIITRSTAAILSAVKGTDIQRMIMLSSFVVKRSRLTHSAKVLTGMVMSKIIADKSSGEAFLRVGGLSWTIVYAVPLTTGPQSNKVRVLPSNKKIGLTNHITRTDVAAWILAEVQNKSYIDQEVIISS